MLFYKKTHERVILTHMLKQNRVKRSKLRKRIKQLNADRKVLQAMIEERT